MPTTPRYANSFWFRGFQNIMNFGSDGPANDRTEIGLALVLLVLEAFGAIAIYVFIVIAIQQL